ncbi:MAG: Tab2/Atab2 family RNA-binding protein [Elainella sp.]
MTDLEKTIWQADFYRRPLKDEAGQTLWELAVCDSTGSFSAQALCPQSQATADWVRQTLPTLATATHPLPQLIQVFRPQALSLLETACQPLGIAVEPNRDTPALKQILQAQDYSSLPNYTGPAPSLVELEKPPPLPLPETLWGERWQFAALTAADLVPAFQSRAIPIRELPESRFPLALKLPSSLPIPGVVIEAGRRAMPLARWLQQAKPYALNPIAGDPDGLILEAGLVDRWVLTTFTDPDVIAAAQVFRERQQAAQGLHFLLVQPDNSGMTYSGFWLLRCW